jgi:hypothetical protein
MSSKEVEAKFIDVDEIETLRNALNSFNRHSSVKDGLLKYFPTNQQYFYNTERALDYLSDVQKHTLREALIEYMNQVPPPKDLENVTFLLNELVCRKHVMRKTHVKIIDIGENIGSVKKPRIDYSNVSRPFEIDFEYCIVCDLRLYNGEVKPRSHTVAYLEEIAQNGSFDRISEDTQSIDHKEFVPLVKEIKSALDISS